MEVLRSNENLRFCALWTIQAYRPMLCSAVMYEGRNIEINAPLFCDVLHWIVAYIADFSRKWRLSAQFQCSGRASLGRTRGRCMSRSGPGSWPARYPYLTALVLFTPENCQRYGVFRSYIACWIYQKSNHKANEKCWYRQSIKCVGKYQY